jgi:predicted metal-dependent hydrolase
MNIKNDKIELGDIYISVAQKDIKNVHLSVHPPMGRVTVSAPLRMTLENVRLFIIAKLGWIRKHQARMRGQKREAPREYVNRESHYYLGKRYLLKIVEQNSASKVILNHDVIELFVHPNATKEQKEALLQSWYRQQLKEIVLPYITKLEKKMNVKVSEVAIRTMKTRWGTCNIKVKRIWLNTELAKKPVESIEYVLTHEMVHLLERNHNEKFIAYMDKFSPKWKHLREELNRSTLGHVDWSY